MTNAEDNTDPWSILEYAHMLVAGVFLGALLGGIGAGAFIFTVLTLFDGSDPPPCRCADHAAPPATAANR